MNAEKTLTHVGTVAKHLASMGMAITQCGPEWEAKHRASIAQIVADFLPSGSGWDRGTTFDMDGRDDRLIFSGSYHHVDNAGMYDGWTDHRIIVTPTFDGISVDVKGRNRNDIKEYLGDIFYQSLKMSIGWDADANRYVRA